MIRITRENLDKLPEGLGQKASDRRLSLKARPEGTIISSCSWMEATRFSKLLPTNIPVPEISVDTDGELRYEWYKGPRQVFSVAVRGDGTLIYAGLFGAGKTHGTEHLDDEVPSVILNNIYRVFSD